MGITHVIRGVDHLTNAARQMQIYAAMGWEAPVFAHVPLIHGPDGAKLSKRHGALGVEAYKEMGYLPAALRNYLVRLGWSHGDDEIMSTVADDRLVRSRRHRPLAGALRFRQARGPQRALHPRHERPGAAAAARGRCCRSSTTALQILTRLDADMRAKLLIAMPGLKERAKTLRELLEGAGFLFAERPIALDDKAATAARRGARAPGSGPCCPNWRQPPTGRRRELEEIVRTYAEAAGAKLGKVAQPLRAALTGKTVSPPVFDVMAVLGRDEALARIRDQAA